MSSRADRHARLAAIAVALACAGLATAAAPARAAENQLFAYPHLLPSPYTVPAGVFVFGSELAFGVTDFLQVGTSLVRDLAQIYNANARVSLVDTPDFALGVHAGYEHYNLRDISTRNPDVTISSWLPGVVTAFALHPQLAVFTGAQLQITSATVSTAGLQTSGYTRGASVESDLAWAYNPPTKSGGIGNVLATGVSYDLTYSLLGVGVSHHWPGFHVGFHYYPNASDRRWYPILTGGGAVQF